MHRVGEPSIRHGEITGGIPRCLWSDSIIVEWYGVAFLVEYVSSSAATSSDLLLRPSILDEWDA